MTTIRILVIDDHPIVRQGISSLLSNYPEFEIVGQADNGQTALALVEAEAPDVTLLDISLPNESGLTILQQIRQLQPAAKVLMLTSYDDEEYVVGALQAGAQGFVLKNVSDEMLVNAIRAVHRGEKILSSQATERVVQRLLSSNEPERKTDDVDLDDEERHILRLLTEGASNTDIAAQLYMSSTSVKRKLRHIFDKLNVQTRAQAAAEAVRRGLV